MHEDIALCMQIYVCSLIDITSPHSLVKCSSFVVVRSSLGVLLSSVLYCILLQYFMNGFLVLLHKIMLAGQSIVEENSSPSRPLLLRLFSFSGLTYFFIKQKYISWGTQILGILHSKFYLSVCFLVVFCDEVSNMSLPKVESCGALCNLFWYEIFLASWQSSPRGVSYLYETLTCCSLGIQYSFSVKSWILFFLPLPASLWLINWIVSLKKSCYWKTSHL